MCQRYAIEYKAGFSAVETAEEHQQRAWVHRHLLTLSRRSKQPYSRCLQTLFETYAAEGSRIIDLPIAVCSHFACEARDKRVAGTAVAYALATAITEPEYAGV